MASVVKENVAPSATSTDSPRKSAPVGAGAGVMQPRHDPNSPNALVFTRPSAAYIRTHGQGRQVVDVVIDPKLGNVLRPHQREGVSFLYECVMGMRDFDGYGAILADEMYAHTDNIANANTGIKGTRKDASDSLASLDAAKYAINICMILY